jgi:hypothetical protein
VPTGFVLDGLDAEAYDRSYSDKALVRRIAEYFRHQSLEYIEQVTVSPQVKTEQLDKDSLFCYSECAFNS